MSGETKISGTGDSLLVQKTAIISLKVTNANKAGCAGKTPTAVGLFRSGKEGEDGVDGYTQDGETVSVVRVDQSEASVRIANVPSDSRSRAESVFTGYDGIVQLNVYFTSITNTSASRFYLRFEFDGGAASSNLVGPLAKEEPADPGKTASLVSSVTTIKPPPQQIEVKKPFKIGLQLRNPEGNAAELYRMASTNKRARMMLCQVMLIANTIQCKCLTSQCTCFG